MHQNMLRRWRLIFFQLYTRPKNSKWILNNLNWRKHFWSEYYRIVESNLLNYFWPQVGPKESPVNFTISWHRTGSGSHKIFWGVHRYVQPPSRIQKFIYSFDWFWIIDWNSDNFLKFKLHWRSITWKVCKIDNFLHALKTKDSQQCVFV